MTTEREKPPSRRNRAQAPIVGNHLPTRNDRIADSTPIQTKASVNAYQGTLLMVTPPRKNTAKTLAASTARVPPSHTGLVTQYRKLFTAPASRPKARRTQTYVPPSSGMAVPSSATSSADGMKKITMVMIIQVKAVAPLDATAPTVSTPTIVQIRKKSISNRPKCFFSFAFSATSA